jgi:hypothetical protein
MRYMLTLLGSLGCLILSKDVACVRLVLWGAGTTLCSSPWPLVRLANSTQHYLRLRLGRCLHLFGVESSLWLYEHL